MFTYKTFSALTSSRQSVLKSIGLTWAMLFVLATAPSVVLASPLSLDPAYDLFETPAGGTTTVTLPGIGPVVLKGIPIGGGLGLGDTDTIVERTNPNPDPIPSGGLGTFDIELVALSLMSTSPVDTTPIGGPGLVDLYVTINKLGLPTIPYPLALPDSTGTLTITSHDDSGARGGTFDSFFDVFADLIFTIPGGDPFSPLDVQPFGLPNGEHFTASGCWSHSPREDDAHTAAFPAGGFYAGVSPGNNACIGKEIDSTDVWIRDPTGGMIPAGKKVLTPEEAQLAEHGVLPGQIIVPEIDAASGTSALTLLLGSLALLGERRRRNQSGLTA